MDPASSSDPFSELILPQPPPPSAVLVEEIVGEEVVVGEGEDDGGGDLDDDKHQENGEDKDEVADKEEQGAPFPPVVVNKSVGDYLDDDDYDSFQVPTVIPIPPAPPPATPPPPTTGASSTSPGKSTTAAKTTSPQAGPSTANKIYSPVKSKKEMDEEDEREKMQLLVSNFSEGQYDRYEMFRRSTFPKAAIKRLMQTITGNAVSQNVVIAMSGIAKVFVGEVVEEALDAMERVGETGPLRPKQLREAVRRLRARSGSSRSSVPRSNTRRYNPFPL